MNTLHCHLKQLNKQKFAEILNKKNTKENEKPEYFHFIDRLLKETPIESDGVLKLFDDDKSLQIAVSTKDGVHAIDFIDWNICLGYKIDEEQLPYFHSCIEEIVYLALYDMSFDGFHIDERTQNIQKIVKRVMESPD